MGLLISILVWRLRGHVYLGLGKHAEIIDRKECIFKLSQGEYVAPGKIENVFSTSSVFAQIFIDGSSLYPFTVALVHLNMEHP